MPIARNTRLNTGGNFGSPKIDLGGCVFYAPLWRQELAGSTFLSSGVYGTPIHTCTVTGATWGIQGRTFNGTSNLISIPSNPAFAFGSGDFTVEAWFYIPTVATTQTLFAGNSDFWLGAGPWMAGVKMGYFASSNGASWDLICADGGPLNGTGGITVTSATWHHWAWTRVGNVWTGYLDLAQDFTVTVAGTLVTKDEAKILGRWGAGAQWLPGTIGEFRAYNRGFSPQEVQRNYLATRWRYN